MSDDLLDALGRLAREQRRAADEDDARWLPHATGVRSADAVSTEVHGDDELARLYVPLGEDVRRAMTERALTELGRQPAGAVVHRLAWRRSVWLFAAAFAMIVGAWLLVPRSIALPTYEVSVAGQSVEWRGASQTAPGGHVAPEADIEIVLRPAARVNGPVLAHAHVSYGGADHPWAGAVLVSPQGAVRLTGGPVRALFGGARGPVEIVVTLSSGHGRPWPFSEDATRTIRVPLVIE